MMGSTISGFSNYATVFWVTGFTLLINFILVLVFAWGILIETNNELPPSDRWVVSF